MSIKQIEYNTNETSRLLSLDIIRAVCLLLMSFCHCREYFGSNNYSNMNWDSPSVWKGHSTIDFIQQAFMTTIGATSFFMLMGVGITFFCKTRLKQNWSIERITHYLMIRGFLLILIQMSILELFEAWLAHKKIIYIGVLAALGGCTILAALMIYIMEIIDKHNKYWTKYIIPLFFSVCILIGLDYFIRHIYLGDYKVNVSNFLLLLSGHYPLGSYDLDVNFTPIPWLPPVAIGLVLGELITTKGLKTLSYIFKIGIILLVTFFIIRFLNLTHVTTFGEYKANAEPNHLSLTAIFCISKYPPSLCYYLWSIGINFIFIAFIFQFEKIFSRFEHYLQPLIVIGQSSLLFFIIHWFVYMCIGTFINKDTDGNLLSFWLLGLCLIIPICFCYKQFKQNHSSSSISRSS